jgi:hypothetical protein
MVGLASTGLIAAIVFHIVKTYIVKPWLDSQPIFE